MLSMFYKQIPPADSSQRLTVLTVAQVSEHVVALLGEGDLVDGVPDKAGLQQVAGILPGFPAVLEPLDVMEEPLHYV